jgi:hypothetical protein
MALKWFENMGTQLNSKAWSESVEEAKITNVLGLAWNYYWAYTKFITGVDITLDMGYKAEFFYADTYKIGYASSTDYTNAKTANIKTDVLAYMASKAQMITQLQSVVTSLTSSVSTSTENVGERTSQVGEEVISRDNLESSTTGAEVHESGSLSFTADEEMELEGASVLVYGYVNINDVLEVLPS